MSDGKDQVLGEWEDLVHMTVAQALRDRQQGQLARELLIRATQAETARTDKQLGSASGGTSVFNKPNLSELLGFAVEHGGVQQKIDGTTATFSTTPYALASMLPLRDDAREQAGYLKHLGASITIPTESVSDRINQFDNYTLSLSFGSRKVNTPAFRAMWEDRLRGAVQNRLDAQTAGVSDLFTIETQLGEVSDALQDVLADLPDTTSGAKLRSVTVTLLYEELYVPVFNGEMGFSEKTRVMVLQNADRIESTETAYQELDAEIQRAANQPLFFFRYVNNRPLSGINYSTLELGFQILTFKAPRFFDLIFNGDISPFHDSEEAGRNLRSFSFSLALETSWNSPFVASELSRSQITGSFGVRWTRREDMDFSQTVAVGQATIPISNGITLPVSLSYASRTELEEDEEWKLNFGLGMDFDMLAAVAAAGRELGRMRP